MIRDWLEILARGEDLTETVAEELCIGIIDARLTPTQVAGALMAFKTKGESVSEIVGMARGMRERCISLDIDADDAIDCCGTGGDGSHSFNVSTAAAIVAAAAGAKVAKHGNRAVSSACGSADILSAVGVKIDATPEMAVRDFKAFGVCFLYAPVFHPAMANVAQTRRELGVRTIFNMLGPLANPARVRRQLIGVYSPSIMERIAASAMLLSCNRGLIVNSEDGLDEISCAAPTAVIEITHGKTRRYLITPEEIGVRSVAGDSLRGNTASENAATLLRLLEGSASAALEATVANAGAGLYLGGIASSIREGVAEARRAISDGRARNLLERWKAGSAS